MELKPQTILQGGRYVIHGVLGRGGFGVTYLAEQVMAKRKVCIKEFFPKDYYTRGDDTRSLTLASQGFATSMNRYKEKFVKEAQTIAALDHANIIPIYDVFEENNTAYYVMEYIDGESLSEVVKRRGALAESEAVEYVRQVASALEYLHDRRIMHLDVKPGNIMLRRKDNRVVLIDFGLSKHYDEQSGEATSTTPVGVSHGYAPLEQYKQGGVSTFSPETDVYSLGATLYALVVGRAPAEAATLITESIDFPHHVSSSLRNAIIAAMAPSPKQRPASVGKFLAMLSGVGVSDKADKTLVVNQPVETDKNPIEQKPAPPSTNEGKPTPPTSNEDKPKTKKSKWWVWCLLVSVVVIIVRNCGGGDYDTYSADVYQENTVETDYIVTDQVDEVVTIDSEALSATVTSDSQFDVVEVEQQSNPLLSLTSRNNMSFDHNKGQGTINYSLTNSKDVPKVTCDKSWVTITSVSKSGTIKFSVAANSGEESRSATINVEYNGQYFSVKLSQSGKPVLRLKSKESISFDHNKGQGTIDYSLTNSEDVPTVTCDKSWVTITSVSKSGTIKFSVAANSGEESRSATINVEYNGQYFNVIITQSGTTYKVGDYYNENGKKGIVFEVWDGGRHGKIVSLDETKVVWDSRVKWKGRKWINGTKTYADSKSDGKANTDKLMSRSDSQYFLAAKWCRDKGASWYLPALNELEAIYNNLDKMNNSLTEVGAKTLDGWYWSSTEEDELRAWYVYTGNGFDFYNVKECHYYVRAVSAF